MTRRLPAICAALLLALPAQAQQARIIDGDTLQIGATRVRMEGIDAPELAQVCPDGWKAGLEARAFLAGLISTGPVHCEYHGVDHYGRALGTCSASIVPDLNRAMVQAGMAWPFLRYSRAYASDAAAARFANRGVWAHDCPPAWDWRKEHR